MALSCSLFHEVCDFCVAAGGIGTVATFIFMIRDSKKKAKQINTIQNIQSHQLESLYEPDLRIFYWSLNRNDLVPEIVLKNYGENIIIMSICEHDELGLLNIERMKGWYYPYHFDKGNELHIPLIYHDEFKNYSSFFFIECRNRLGMNYEFKIINTAGKFVINGPFLK